MAEKRLDTRSAGGRTQQRAEVLLQSQRVRREVFGREGPEPSPPHAPPRSTYNGLEKPARLEAANRYCCWASVPHGSSRPSASTA
jgi:hypothetical protein